MLVNSNNINTSLNTLSKTSNYTMRNDIETKKSEEAENQKKKTNDTIFAGDLNIGTESLEEKKKEAQNKALKVLGDAFAIDKGIDDDLNARREHIKELDGMGKAANKELVAVESGKEELKKEYEITEDSQEEKDLQLLLKRRNSEKMHGMISFTEEEKTRLAEIDAKGLTEYQEQFLELEERKEYYTEQANTAKNGIILETGTINAIKLGRIQITPMIDAKEEADQIMDTVSDEITQELIDESKNHVDKDLKEEKEEAEQKAEKEKEIEEQIEAAKAKKQENESSVSQYEEISEMDTSFIGYDLNYKAAQKQVQVMLDKVKLLGEDVKGVVVDAMK